MKPAPPVISVTPPLGVASRFTLESASRFAPTFALWVASPFVVASLGEHRLAFMLDDVSNKMRMRALSVDGVPLAAGRYPLLAGPYLASAGPVRWSFAFGGDSVELRRPST